MQAQALNSQYKPNDPLVFSLVLVATLTAIFATEVYIPSLPAITKAFAINNQWAQFTLIAYLISMGCSQIIYGPLSDRYGRKRVLLIGLSINVIGATLCSAATSIMMLVIGRFIQGAGVGAIMCLSRSIIRDIFDNEHLAKAAAVFGLCISLAVALSPVLGGYLQTWFSWRANFIFLLFYGISILLLIIALLPETNLHLQPDATKLTHVMHNYWELLTHPTFARCLICSSTAISGLLVYYTIAPFLLQNIVGLTPVEFGWLGIANASTMLLSRYCNTYLLNRLTPQQLLHFGNLSMVLGSLVMLVLSVFHIIDAWSIVLPMLLFIFGSGFIFSNAMATAFNDLSNHNIGHAGALFGGFQILSAFLASLTASYLHSSNAIALAIILVVLGIINLISLKGLPQQPANT